MGGIARTLGRPQRIVPAETLDRARLAELFTAGYEDYLVPLQVDEPAFDFMVGALDIDLARSRVAERDGEPVGIARSRCAATTGGSEGSASSRRRAGPGSAGA